MAKFTEIRLRQAPEWQAKRLNAWLAERELEIKLRQAPPPPPVASPLLSAPNRLGGLVQEHDDERVAVGQVRLMSPKMLSNSPRPLYFAVVADWEGEMKLIAPYGNYLEPASTGELLTSRQDLALRVLC